MQHTVVPTALSSRRSDLNQAEKDLATQKNTIKCSDAEEYNTAETQTQLKGKTHCLVVNAGGYWRITR